MIERIKSWFRRRGTQVALAVPVVKTYLRTRALERRVHGLNQQIRKMAEKYPEVWLPGNVAMGCVQIPRLKRTFEFYREENRFCVCVPWRVASGVRPTEFVPPWLEVDSSQEICSTVEQMDGKSIVYKIPILGWNDTVELTRGVQDDHPSYGVNGKIQEKIKTFRSVKGWTGIYRREKSVCHVWFVKDEINMEYVAKSSPQILLPAGNLEYSELGIVDSSVEGTFVHFKIPVKERELPLPVRFISGREKPALTR